MATRNVHDLTASGTRPTPTISLNGAVVRYTVEFRRHHLDPWQEAEEAIHILQDQDPHAYDVVPRTEYRVTTIEFSAADWEDA